MSSNTKNQEPSFEALLAGTSASCMISSSMCVCVMMIIAILYVVIMGESAKTAGQVVASNPAALLALA